MADYPPTYALPSTAAGPKFTTKEGHESGINAGFSALFNEILTRVAILEGELGARISATGDGNLSAGGWDAGGGVFPSSSVVGTFFDVIGDGVVDGVSFKSNDILRPLVANASTDTYAGNWVKVPRSNLVRRVYDGIDDLKLTAEDRGPNEVHETKDGYRFRQVEPGASGDGIVTYNAIPMIAVGLPALSAVARGAVPSENGLAAVNYASELQAALEDVASRGGGDVTLPYGEIGWSGVITVPDGVNLHGMQGNSRGSGENKGSVLKALDSSAQLVFGRGANTGDRGGLSSGLLIDGNNVGGSDVAPLVHFDSCHHRSFIGMLIMDSAGDAMWVDYCQNNRWWDLYIARSAGNGLVMNRGAGGNRFREGEIAQSGGYGLLFKGEDSGPISYSVPTDNELSGFLIERGHASEQTTAGMVRSDAGDRNRLVGGVLSVGDDFTIDGGGAVLQAAGGALEIENLTISSSAQTHNLIHQAGGNLTLQGKITLKGGSVGYIYDSGGGEMNAFLDFVSCSSEFGGAGSLNNRYHWMSKAPLITERAGAARLTRMRQAGDSSFRLQVNGSGGLEWADGAAGADVALNRYAAGVLRTDGMFLAVNGLGVGNSEASPVTGSITRRVPIYSSMGSYLGKLAVYDDPE